VADLTARFGVSAVTIRQDLRVLEVEGRVVRAHGGALAPGRSRPERAFEVRERLQRDEKERIGATAAALVVDGESIALDASTTALAMARHLKARGGWVHLTVITNGLRIASELAGHPGITVAMPGGFVRWEALSVVGPLGRGLLEKVNIQKAFMGAAGYTLETGLSDATDDEAQIKGARSRLGVAFFRGVAITSSWPLGGALTGGTQPSVCSATAGAAAARPAQRSRVKAGSPPIVDPSNGCGLRIWSERRGRSSTGE